MAKDPRAGDLVRNFPRIVRLVLTIPKNLCESEISLAPLCKSSPSLKSIHVDFPFLQLRKTFDLILSFPLLEDLALFGHKLCGSGPHGSQAVDPSPSPAFTGSLDLNMPQDNGNTTRRLLDLPNGLHFRKLVLTQYAGEYGWIMELVTRRSDTLECLNVGFYLPCTFVLVLHWIYDLLSSAGDIGPASIDLSKATKLRDVVFQPAMRTVTWIITALQTITTGHRDLRQISIHVPNNLPLTDDGGNVGQIVGEVTYREWLDLDDLLVQFWESRSIHPKVILDSTMWVGKGRIKYCIGYLLPEITKRGIIDLVRLVNTINTIRYMFLPFSSIT